MVAELDPHSAYMNPRDFALFNEDTEGTFGGIGVEVDFKDERILVIAPIPGSPAARAGSAPAIRSWRWTTGCCWGLPSTRSSG